jgi:hypothetical protein
VVGTRAVAFVARAALQVEKPRQGLPLLVRTHHLTTEHLDVITLRIGMVERQIQHVVPTPIAGELVLTDDHM